LRECSGVGTAQWQYLLPNKSKSRVVDPFRAFRARVQMFVTDMRIMKRQSSMTDARLLRLDARQLQGVGDVAGRVKLILTSPPYPNNFDYADATRLEMTFWGQVSSWGDLHGAVRHLLVRSCSQHSAAEHLKLDSLLNDSAIAPIADELSEVCRTLETVRETKGGRKSYHTMVAAYFIDLAKTWSALYPLCADEAKACFVIGDSAPYGVYVPVDKWLSELALAAGFHSPRFEQIRERNMKWKKSQASRAPQGGAALAGEIAWQFLRLIGLGRSSAIYWKKSCFRFC